MAVQTLCSECRTAHRTGSLFCVVCGRRLPRASSSGETVVAVAWPGPEVPQVSLPLRTSAFAVASLVAGVLAWSVLPLLGAALAVLLALHAQDELRASRGTLGGTSLVRVGLFLGGLQLGLALLVGSAVAAVALVSLLRVL